MLTGQASPSQYQAALAVVTYSNSSDNAVRPDAHNASYQVNDGSDQNKSEQRRHATVRHRTGQ